MSMSLGSDQVINACALQVLVRVLCSADPAHDCTACALHVYVQCLHAAADMGNEHVTILFNVCTYQSG